MFRLASFSIVFGLFYLVVIGLSIWSFVLFIKLALRGIKALDIYIENNKDQY